MKPLMNIYSRERIEVNTDPQRRCYNGCHFSSEWQWTEWSILNVGVHADRVEAKLKFWRDLNEYAVKERGKGALAEFKAVPVPESIGD